MKFLSLVFFFSLSLFAVDTGTLWTIEMGGGTWGPKKAIYLTGFGPFGLVSNNPSGRIVHAFAEEIKRRCPQGFETVKSKELPVVPGSIESIRPEKYSTVISVGVAASSPSIRVERFAENWYEDKTQSGPISTAYPAHSYLEGPSLPSLDNHLNGFDIELGRRGTAGTYVCNDTFYRLCLHGEKGYFIHIPDSAMERDRDLVSALTKISCKLLSRTAMLD